MLNQQTSTTSPYYKLLTEYLTPKELEGFKMPPSEPDIDTWWQFIISKNFNRIDTRQLEEINHFKKLVSEGVKKTEPKIITLIKENPTVIPDALIPDIPESTDILDKIYPQGINLTDNMLEALTQMNGPATTMHELKERHHFLDNLNIHLIINKKEEKLWSTVFDLQFSGLTRLPEQIFYEKPLQEYWPNIKRLHLDSNQIQSLPDALGDICKNLTDLTCMQNSLKFLPDSLGNFHNLIRFGAGENKLEYLPNTIGNWKKLTWLSVSDNALTSLPDSIGNCLALEILSASNNQLVSLPEALTNCKELSELTIENNKLRFVPTSLRSKLGFGLDELFGLDRYEEALKSQKPREWSELLPTSLSNVWNSLPSFSSFQKINIKRKEIDNEIGINNEKNKRPKT